MTVWATSSTTLKDVGQPVMKASCWNLPVKIGSLKINSKYKFYDNNVDMGWACKPVGKKLGDDLVSNDSGIIEFTFLFETSYQTSYALNVSKSKDTITQNLTCELVPDSGGRSAIFYIPVSMRASQ